MEWDLIRFDRRTETNVQIYRISLDISLNKKPSMSSIITPITIDRNVSLNSIQPKQFHLQSNKNYEKKTEIFHNFHSLCSRQNSILFKKKNPKLNVENKSKFTISTSSFSGN